MATAKTSPTKISATPVDVSQPKSSGGMPGWLKGCLVGCVVILVLLGIAGGVAYYFATKYIFTPERMELIKQAAELSKGMDPADAKNLQTFMQKAQDGQITLTADQEKQATVLMDKVSTDTYDDKAIDETAILLASIDPATFKDTEKWKKYIKTAIPFLKSMTNELKKLEATPGTKDATLPQPTQEQ